VQVELRCSRATSKAPHGLLHSCESRCFTFFVPSLLSPRPASLAFKSRSFRSSKHSLGGASSTAPLLPLPLLLLLLALTGFAAAAAALPRDAAAAADPAGASCAGLLATAFCCCCGCCLECLPCSTAPPLSAAAVGGVCCRCWVPLPPLARHESTCELMNASRTDSPQMGHATQPGGSCICFAGCCCCCGCCLDAASGCCCTSRSLPAKKQVHKQQNPCQLMAPAVSQQCVCMNAC
jgi:hypothetical protein